VHQGSNSVHCQPCTPSAICKPTYAALDASCSADVAVAGVLLLLQAEMYEGAHNISKLIALGPVPGVKTYCIYGEATLHGDWPSSSSGVHLQCGICRE
jgi:hypothetical protein